MPAPTTPATFQRPDLGQAYEEFDLMAHMQGFVGLQCMPQTPVALQTSNFSKLPIEQLLNDGRDVHRASGAGYARQKWSFEQDNYATTERGAEEVLDDRERAIYGYTGIRFEQTAADRACSAILRDLEIEIQGILQDATTYSSQVTSVTTEWDTAATATPISDVLAARESFKGSCGVYPNAIVMSEKVFVNLLNTAEFRDNVKYSQLSTVGAMAANKALVAQALLIDNVIVGGAIRNSANAGQAATIADIWNDEWVTLLLVPQGDDLKSPGFGRTFSFQDMITEQYRDERIRSDVMRCRIDLDVKVIHSECLWILDNITT